MQSCRSSPRIPAFAGTGPGTQSGQSKRWSQRPLGSRLRGNERRIRHASINWKSYRSALGAWRHPAGSMLPVYSHARGRDMGPDALGSLGLDTLEPTRNGRIGCVGELHEWRTASHQAEGLLQQAKPHLERLGEQRQTRHHRGGGLAQNRRQQRAQPVGVALDDGCLRIALAQQTAEGRVELDQHEASRINPARHQRLGHWPSAGSELDDRTIRMRIHVIRHGAGERLAGRRHRAHRQRLLDPGAEETKLVVDANPVLQLEATDVGFESFLLRIELLLNAQLVSVELLADALLLRRELAFELAAKRTVPQLKKPDLPFDLAFENLEGLDGHWTGDATK